MSSSYQWREGAAENRPASAEGPATDFRSPAQYGNLPNIAQVPVAARGLTLETPPEKRRREEENGPRRGKRRGQEQPVVAGSSAGRNAEEKKGATGANGRMDAAELAAKKLLLPFINELSFVEIALAEVGYGSVRLFHSKFSLFFRLFLSLFWLAEGMLPGSPLSHQSTLSRDCFRAAIVQSWGTSFFSSPVGFEA